LIASIELEMKTFRPNKCFLKQAGVPLLRPDKPTNQQTHTHTL